MPQYLLSVHNGEESPYASEEEMQQAFADTGKVNEAMQAAGVWVFAGGLMPASTASVVRVRDGVLDHTDGPYLEAKEHIGGFWIDRRSRDPRVHGGGLSQPGGPRRREPSHAARDARRGPARDPDP